MAATGWLPVAHCGHGVWSQRMSAVVGSTAYAHYALRCVCTGFRRRILAFRAYSARVTAQMNSNVDGRFLH